MPRNVLLPEERRPALRTLLETGRGLRAIEFHNPLSAMIGEAARVASTGAEFDLLWASGFTNATAMGLPDAELWLLERRMDTIADSAAVTRKPLIVDVDTGGDAFALATLCSRLETLGVSAVVVEDKTGTKRTSLAESVHHELEDPEVFVKKIELAKGALRSKDLLVFARTESLISGHGVTEALSRAQRYLASDADGLVIHSKDATGREVREFLEQCRKLPQRLRVRKPIIVIPTAYNHVHDNELFAMGASIVIHANHLLRAAYKAMREAAEAILEADRSQEADRLCAPVAQLLHTVGTGDLVERSEAPEHAYELASHSRRS